MSKTDIIKEYQLSVIVDDGWSKCTHKHTYNDKSGVGIIIGKQTSKIFSLGQEQVLYGKGIDYNHHNHHCFFELAWVFFCNDRRIL